MNKFVGFLEAAGKNVERGLEFAVKEAPAIDALLGIFWPASQVVTAPATVALNLIQNSVISIEQKYAAAGVQTGTGMQKAAEVLTLTAPAVTSLLTTAGVKNVDDTYISRLIAGIVGILNATQTPAPAVTQTKAA